MPPAPADDLETFLKRQDRSTLVNVLIELANDHEAVQARLTRLGAGIPGGCEAVGGGGGGGGGCNGVIDASAGCPLPMLGM